MNKAYFSDFQRKREYDCCGFFIQPILADRNNNFQEKFLYPIEDSDFLSSIFKKIFQLR